MTGCGMARWPDANLDLKRDPRGSGMMLLYSFACSSCWSCLKHNRSDMFVTSQESSSIVLGEKSGTHC